MRNKIPLGITHLVIVFSPFVARLRGRVRRIIVYASSSIRKGLESAPDFERKSEAENGEGEPANGHKTDTLAASSPGKPL